MGEGESRRDRKKGRRREKEKRLAAVEAAGGWRERGRVQRGNQGVEREAAAEANRLHRRSAPNNDSRPRSVAREPRSREHLSVSLSLCSRRTIPAFRAACTCEPARAQRSEGDTSGRKRATHVHTHTHTGGSRPGYCSNLLLLLILILLSLSSLLIRIESPPNTSERWYRRRESILSRFYVLHGIYIYIFGRDMSVLTGNRS